MSIVALKNDILATDTLVSISDAEHPDPRMRVVIPPSLRIKRAPLPSGGRVIRFDGAPWVFALASETPHALEQVRQAIETAGVQQSGKLSALLESLPDESSLLAIHPVDTEVRFLRKRLRAGQDASIIKTGLSSATPFAIGTGSWIALSAMRQRGLNAIRAVQEVCLKGNDSGGQVWWLDLTSGVEGTHTCPKSPEPSDAGSLI
jgi:hypothetical protein